MVKVYHRKGLVYRLATKTMRKAVELAFEGELIARRGNGEDIFEPDIRAAAARDAVRKTKIPVLEEELHHADALVEQEVTRLATHRGSF